MENTCHEMEINALEHTTKSVPDTSKHQVPSFDHRERTLSMEPLLHLMEVQLWTFISLLLQRKVQPAASIVIPKREVCE